MKTSALLFVLLALAGCVTRAQVVSADIAKCKSYGFQEGTEPFARCRMELDRQHAAAAKEPIGITNCSTNYGQTNCVSY
jgi:hypothetical protein